MLDVENATSYLIERGVIDRSAFVEGALTLAAAARRNRNLRIEAASGSGYLIKQPDVLEESAHFTLRSEAAFHRLCTEQPSFSVLAEFLPRLIDYDDKNVVLVFKLVPDAHPLGPLDLTSESSGAGRALGRALGTIHRAFRPLQKTRDPRLSWLSRQIPGALVAHKPEPGLLATLSAANALTLRIIQADERLGARLDDLRQSWRPETVIHGDVKFDNILVVPPRGEVRIVDWELVNIGDPAWDLAGVLQDFLVHWTQSMPVSTTLTVDAMTTRARHPLASLRPAIRAVWQGYRSAAGLETSEGDALLDRAVAFSAARLIQSVHELSDESEHLSVRSVLLLQLAANILADPGLARVHLFGIPLEFPTR
jgi:Ser/Thr protein kinase RdoA (MazF antagonist)